MPRCTQIRQIRITAKSSTATSHLFARTFTLGRSADCDVQVDDNLVSRVHAEVVLQNGRWLIRDLDSTNGTYLAGRPIEEIEVDDDVELRLASDGPAFQLTFEEGVDVPDTTTECVDIQERESSADAVDTMSGRESRSGGARGSSDLSYHLARQRVVYGTAIVAALLVALAFVGYSAFQQRRLASEEASRREVSDQLESMRAAAAKVFDGMRAFEVQIAELRSLLEASGKGDMSSQLRDLEEARRQMARDYDGYVAELGIYRGLDEKEKLIYRIARAFNESESVMPAGFVRSVQRTIDRYWLTPAGRNRFRGAIIQATKRGYTRSIARALEGQGLPRQFFYMALQESNLNTAAVGPLTRWGRAKGMWQFIPTTARKFGLHPGPFPNRKDPHPADERHDFERSTEAAARYLRFIYRTLAQASGLLVMASYNWGEHRVVDKLERLDGSREDEFEQAVMQGIPQNPNARSYWALSR